MTAAVPVVLLHPFPLDSRFWTPLRPLLPPGRDVLAPDAPGMGGAPQRPGWTVDDAADAVAAAVAGTPAGRAAVCGLSMGGYVALALAARHPARVAALVLADTRAEPDDEAARAGRDRGIARVTGGDLEGFLDELVPRLVSPSAPAGAVTEVRRIAGEQSPQGVAGALAALRDRPDRTPALAGIAVPTVVVWGEDDAVTPRAAAEALAAGIPGARLEVVPGAGHLSAAERPEAFAAAVAGVL